MLQNYLLYLEYITKKIQKFFESQKAYICCKKGCSKCCRQAQFPFSKIEFEFIYMGLLELVSDIQKQVLDNIDKTIIAKQKHNEERSDEKFRYDCPFLINNECSVYEYRGLVCRTFGLLTFIKGKEKELNIPFCAYEGLNYSSVIEEVQNKITNKGNEDRNSESEIMAYNLDYSTLINEKSAGSFGVEFGEVKPLIEWFIEWKADLIEKVK